MPSALDLIGRNRVLQEHWARRVIAAVIDWVLLTIILAILSVFFFLSLAFLFRFGLGPYNPFLVGLGNLPFALVALLYFTLFEGLAGHSPGKALLGLKVTAPLEQMGLAKAFIRNLSKTWWVFLLIDFILGFATQGDPRQRFLDRVAGTTVVRTGTAALEEEQFHRPQASRPPPPAGGSAPAQGAPAWPQHELDPQGEPVRGMRFCSACGGPLVPRGDGKLTCTRCGAAY